MMVVRELNRYMMAIPARIMVAAEVCLRVETRMMTVAGIREKTKAITIVAADPPRLPREMPRPIARVAPNDAPDEIPVV